MIRNYAFENESRLNIHMSLTTDTTYSSALLTQHEQAIIENDILGFHFPWYYISKQTTFIPPADTPEKIKEGTYVNTSFLSHSLLRRTEEEHIKHTDRPIDHFSDGYAEFFFSIFDRWMKSNNKTYHNIFRANVNCNWYNGEDAITVPHNDHTWHHYNWLMYLTDNPEAPTLVWDYELDAWHEMPAQKYQVSHFKGCYHAHKYPALHERRVAVVFTYA